jgi:hypothetical protein
VTVIVLVSLLSTAWGGDVADQATIFKVVAELLALPAFMFGGPWLTSRLLEDVDLPAMLPFYVTALAIVVCPIGIYLVIQKVVVLGRQIGSAGGGPNG